MTPCAEQYHNKCASPWPTRRRRRRRRRRIVETLRIKCSDF
jgi:hypothetical protein